MACRSANDMRCSMVLRERIPSPSVYGTSHSGTDWWRSALERMHYGISMLLHVSHAHLTTIPIQCS